MDDIVEGKNKSGPKPKGWQDRFWKYVRIVSDSECWLWTGNTTKKGYGTLSICGATVLAHRLSYLIKFGRLDPGLMIMHSCDNRICVNPNHLQMGTATDNARDAVGKLRMGVGELNGGAKLTSLNVNEIRNRRASGETLGVIAKDYNVWPSCISRICNRTRWSHL